MTVFNKVFSPFSSALKDADVANKADADSEKFVVMHGRNRYFYEMLTGQGPDTDTPLSVRNPQGLVGIDHSGPPFGQALKHAVWQVTGIDSTGSYLNQSRSIDIVDPQEPLVVNCGFYVKPFPAIENTPHSRVFLCLRLVNKQAGAATISILLRFNGQEISTNLPASGGGAYSILQFTAASVGAKVFPGWNQGTIEVSSNIATAANPVRIIQMSLNVNEKFGF